MKITGFEVRHVELPYVEPVQWRSVYEESGQYLLLRVCTDEGLFGLAEVADKPTWTGSTVRVTAQTLKEIYEPLLTGLDPLASEQIKAKVETIPGWSSAKSVLDVALTDLAARHAGLPLWQHLGGFSSSVWLAWLVNRGPVEKRVEETRAAVERYGFTALKVKIGMEPRADLQLVERLREAFGADMYIAVDANSAYTRRQARAVAEGLAEMDVALFEDPCVMAPDESVAGFLAGLPLPVMADMAVPTPREARAFLDAGAEAIALKLGRTGYARSERIREMCEEQGALCGMGVYAESGLGSLLSLHLHAAHKHFQQVPAENCFFLKVKEDVVAEPLTVTGGRIQLPERPGVGVELDPEALEGHSTIL